MSEENKQLYFNDCLFLSDKAELSFPIEFYKINESNQALLPTIVGRLLLESYRSKEMLREQYRHKASDQLVKYLEDYVFPTDRNGISHGKPETAVKSGDFGEVIMTKLVLEAHQLTIPFEKMFWKLRHDRSSFCTDIFAHNSGDPISQLHYYEVKVRQKLAKAASKRRTGSFHVGVIAHDSLARDSELPSEQIADFLRRKYFELATESEKAGNISQEKVYRSHSIEYGKIVDNSKAYSRHYCVSLVLDSDKAFSAEILGELDNLPPELKPLRATIVLLPAVSELVTSSFKKAFDHALDFVFEDKG